MNKEKIKKICLLSLVGILTMALSGFFTPGKSQAFDISVNISPNIINLESSDHAFGIHTSMPYSDVNISAVVLVCPNDYALYPIVCYADSLGNLVAKFSTSDLEADCDLVMDDYNTLVLEGETKIDPEFFSGAGEVLIIESQPKFQNGNGIPKKQAQNCRNR